MLIRKFLIIINYKYFENIYVSIKLHNVSKYLCLVVFHLLAKRIQISEYCHFSLIRRYVILSYLSNNVH